MDNDHKEPDGERLYRLAEAVLVAYAAIAGYLAELPVPIRIPEATPEWDGYTVTTAVDRARTLIGDEPIPEMPKSILGTVLVEWLTAYDLSTLAVNAGPIEWRLDALELSLARIAAGLDLVASMLPPDGDEE